MFLKISVIFYIYYNFTIPNDCGNVYYDITCRGVKFALAQKFDTCAS